MKEGASEERHPSTLPDGGIRPLTTDFHPPPLDLCMSTGLHDFKQLREETDYNF